MMIKEPISAETEPLPTFEPTLVVAFPDVLMAGPKILLSAAPHADSIPGWSHFCTTPAPTLKKGTTSTGATSLASQMKKKTLQANAIRYSTVSTGGQGGIGLLTITVTPPTNEQSSYLCEAIVNQAKVSEEQLGLATVPKDVSLGDHILNTLLTLLTYIDIPTTALVHPAKKGTNLRDTKDSIF
ncbi:hypothetical protein BG015_009535 [Linnemannia schmuckeri]|uniref:Uncharacterized protein n=1 Tax=Linnemannia schmuckeri TaxID=64567 RepID=A0A9P5V9J4_9FUNG|nr:hypothetical protein BG015_009535 [Linnemannia schmuckeri]